tara:strand:- start:520 stop:798 length:279 start_codon:yes stop_codon:yes gene_type:complete
MNTLNKADKKIEQGTTVYHKEYGKGSIIYVQYRTKDSLCMCYFPKAKVHDWVTEKELLVGTGDVTLTQVGADAQKDQPTLESLLETLFKPNG